MLKKILNVLTIVAVIIWIGFVSVKLLAIDQIIQDSVFVLQEQIEILQRQSTINDLSLSSDLTELARSTLKIEESIKEVDYNKIIRGDVLVMGIFGSGAGTVIKKTENEMYVLTCYHVVDDIIKLNEGGLKVNAIIGYSLGETGDIDNLKSFVSFSAEVVKSDEENDLALLKVNYSDPNLSEIKIAEQEPQKGDTVYSVGSPLGLLRTVSKGILANKIEGFYLTDGTTTFGNSGGGLYNKDCELIGVPSNVMGYASGLGKDGKETFVPESSLGLSRNLPTIKAFLEGVI
jgi:serine protease Do